MIIIGEKINGSRKQIAKAIAEHDTDYIQQLAHRQIEAGSNWLDIHAGTTPESELETLVWLIETVQKVADIPLCLDSTDSSILNSAMSHVRYTPMINSISGEKKRFEGMLQILRDYKCPVIMLAIDDTGIPKTVEDRIKIISKLINEIHKQVDMDDRHIYVDPLIMALSADAESGNIALNAIRRVRDEFPEVHIVSGLSNVSFGLPARSIINQAFLTLAIEAGLDSAILDPLDKGLYSSILATEVILGRDRFCSNYNRAYRSGRLT